MSTGCPRGSIRLAATLGQLGKHDEYRKAAIELLAFKQDFSK
jgi:hypothetical protein